MSTQEGLLAELPRPAGRVLFAGAEGARTLLADELGADVVPLYRTVELAPTRRPTATSSCSPRLGGRARSARSAAVPAVSIGPETTRAARGGGVEVVAEAATHDLDGVVAAADAALRP